MSLLSEKLAPIWSEISKLRARQMSIFPATVTSIDPVRIRIDGEGQSLAASPTTMDPVFPGNRVRVLRYGTAHLVLGVVGPTSQTGRFGFGSGTIGPGETATTTVVYPVPYTASAPPVVAVQPVGSSRLLARVLNVTSTQFDVAVRNVTNSGTAATAFTWLSIPAEAE